LGFCGEDEVLVAYGYEALTDGLSLDNSDHGGDDDYIVYYKGDFESGGVTPWGIGLLTFTTPGNVGEAAGMNFQTVCMDKDDVCGGASGNNQCITVKESKTHKLVSATGTAKSTATCPDDYFMINFSCDSSSSKFSLWEGELDRATGTDFYLTYSFMSDGKDSGSSVGPAHPKGGICTYHHDKNLQWLGTTVTATATCAKYPCSDNSFSDLSTPYISDSSFETVTLDAVENAWAASLYQQHEFAE